MKKIILFLTVILSLSSCRIYQIQNDEFKGNRTVMYWLNCKSAEYSRNTLGLPSAQRTANMEYLRTIGDKGETLRIFFKISSSASSFEIEKTGYIKAGDKIFDFELADHNSTIRSSTTSQTSSSITKDSTQTVTSSSAETNTYEWKSDRFVLEATPEIIEAIRNADKIQFRFYFGAQTATFILTGRQQKRLIKMFKQ